MVQQLVKQYIEKWRAYEEEYQRLQSESRLTEAKRLPVVGWKDEIVVPLAKELGKRVGMSPLVFGPCGLGNKVYISLVKDPEIPRWKQSSLNLVVQPQFPDGESCVLEYETGEMTDRYEPDTLGYANGLNAVTAVLPDSVDEILLLMRTAPPLELPTSRENTRTACQKSE